MGGEARALRRGQPLGGGRDPRRHPALRPGPPVAVDPARRQPVRLLRRRRHVLHVPLRVPRHELSRAGRRDLPRALPVPRRRARPPRRPPEPPAGCVRRHPPRGHGVRAAGVDPADGPVHARRRQHAHAPHVARLSRDGPHGAVRDAAARRPGPARPRGGAAPHRARVPPVLGLGVRVAAGEGEVHGARRLPRRDVDDVLPRVRRGGAVAVDAGGRNGPRPGSHRAGAGADPGAHGRGARRPGERDRRVALPQARARARERHGVDRRLRTRGRAARRRRERAAEGAGREGAAAQPRRRGGRARADARRRRPPRRADPAADRALAAARAARRPGRAAATSTTRSPPCAACATSSPPRWRRCDG